MYIFLLDRIYHFMSKWRTLFRKYGLKHIKGTDITIILLLPMNLTRKTIKE